MYSQMAEQTKIQQVPAQRQLYITKTLHKLRQLLSFLNIFRHQYTDLHSNAPVGGKYNGTGAAHYRSEQITVQLLQEPFHKSYQVSYGSTNMHSFSRKHNANTSVDHRHHNFRTANLSINGNSDGHSNIRGSSIYSNTDKYRQHLIKFKMVNQFMTQIDTNLDQVTSGLQAIYTKICQYEDLQAIHQMIKSICQTNIPKRTNQSHLRTYHTYKQAQYATQAQEQEQNQKQEYSKHVFQDIFIYIYKTYFSENILQIINKKPKRFALYLLQIQTKLSILPELIDSASKFVSDITCYNRPQPSHHVFGQGENEERYSYAWKNIQVKSMDNLSETIKGQINYLKKMMKITTSAVVTQNASVNLDLVKKIVFGLSFPIFWVADQQSELRCYKLWRKPKVQSLNNVWNLPQNGAIKQCKKLVFPSIKTNFFIYIPTNNIHNDDRFLRKYKTVQHPQIFLQPSNHPQQSIRVLVLYNGKLNYRKQSKKHQPYGCFSCWDIAQQVDLQTIIIHFHGGGFVALSSQTTQSYTRVWANKIKVPIFSVDYRKPPQFRFPTALYDCYTAYQFIIQRINQYFNITPKNVILTGDSAGGNLAVALQGLLMRINYPIKPKGIYLAYPAVDLRMKFSPSRMNSFDDPILIPPLLLLCLKQYLGQNALNQYNSLASPILLSQYFIQTGQQPKSWTKKQLKNWPKNWPPTRIMVGKKDPLYDDSLRLLQRMSYAGIDVKLIIYSQFSHAFLSMNLVITACQQAIEDSIIQIKKLIQM